MGHTFSSWNNSFLHAWITKLISYYLKLKFSQWECPIGFAHLVQVQEHSFLSDMLGRMIAVQGTC